jgi:tRNA(adenine34) deaminase
MLSFMELALDEARKAQDLGEVPVGCVIVRDGAVIAAAGNRTLTDRDPTAHAEIIAIRAAARVLGSERLTECDLHVTPSPARCVRQRFRSRASAGSITARPTPRAALSTAAFAFSRRRPATTGLEVYGGISEAHPPRYCGIF